MDDEPRGDRFTLTEEQPEGTVYLPGSDCHLVLRYERTKGEGAGKSTPGAPAKSPTRAETGMERPKHSRAYRDKSRELSFPSSGRDVEQVLDRPVTILFLAMNPQDKRALRLTKEYEEIDAVHSRSKHSKNFRIEQWWGARPDQLQRCLQKYDPDLVHFSGHGKKTGEVIFEDQLEGSFPVRIEALSQLFCVAKGRIQCVVLNICFSVKQASQIAQHVGCAVGMSDELPDEVAICFAASFYEALCAGRSVKVAFELGRTQIHLLNPDNPEYKDIPQLFSSNCDPDQVVFV